MATNRGVGDGVAINISQANIFNKLDVYFTRQQRNKTFLSYLDSDDIGFCCGYATLAAYCMWLDFITEQDAGQDIEKDGYAWFEETLIKFSQWDDTAEEGCAQLSPALLNDIERLFSLVRYFQLPNAYGHHQGETEKLLVDTRDRKFAVDYSLAGYFSSHDLLKCIFIMTEDGSVQITSLIDVLVKEHKMVMIYSRKHVTSLVKHRNIFFHYDANNVTGRAVFDETQKLVEDIVSAHFNISTSDVLYFRVVDEVTKEKANYPDQAVLLHAVYKYYLQQEAVVRSQQYYASLLMASLAGCVPSASYYLQQLCDRTFFVNHVDDLGLAPLHYASASGELKLVEMLLVNGAQVNQQDPYGMTPLYMAVCLFRCSVARLLLAAGADPNVKTSSGLTMLYRAVEKDCIELIVILLCGGAKSINTQNAPNVPLHLACEKGNLPAVKLLVQYGAASIHQCDNRGQTPLSLALQHQHYVVAQYLFSLLGIQVELDELLDIEQQKALLSWIIKLDERTEDMSHTRHDNATQIRTLSSTAAMLLVITAGREGAPLPVRQQVDIQPEDAKQDNKQHQAKMMVHQPSLIKRDPHCTLPGHYGKRLTR